MVVAANVTAFAKQGLAIAFVLGWCGACSDPPEPMIDSAKVREECPSIESVDYFFPEYLFAVRGYSGKGFAATLSMASESSLSCGAIPAETYRIASINSFSESVILRIAGPEGVNGAEVVTTELERHSHERFRVTKRARRQLDRLEWNRLKTDFDRLAFWSTPMFPAQRGGPATAGHDGSSWLLEGRDRTRYHAVLRAGHEMPPGFPELLKTLQQLGGIER